MKITVVADTHRDFHKLLAVAEQSLDSDMLIHLGDGQHEFIDVSKMFRTKEFIFVKGENDFSDFQEETVVTVGMCRLFCTHGHKYNVHDGLDRVIERAKEENCQIALYGHTHYYRTELIDGIYVMNPGSASTPRGKNPCTYGIIEIGDNGKITMNIVELKLDDEGDTHYA